MYSRRAIFISHRFFSSLENQIRAVVNEKCEAIDFRSDTCMFRALISFLVFVFLFSRFSSNSFVFGK